jgi:hypothetical protein
VHSGSDRTVPHPHIDLAERDADDPLFRFAASIIGKNLPRISGLRRTSGTAVLAFGRLRVS